MIRYFYNVLGDCVHLRCFLYNLPQNVNKRHVLKSKEKCMYSTQAGSNTLGQQGKITAFAELQEEGFNYLLSTIITHNLTTVRDDKQ